MVRIGDFFICDRILYPKATAASLDRNVASKSSRFFIKKLLKALNIFRTACRLTARDGCTLMVTVEGVVIVDSLPLRADCRRTSAC